MHFFSERYQHFPGAALALTAVFLLSAFAAPPADKASETVRVTSDNKIYRVFSVGEGGTLSVTSDRGSIDVMIGQRDRVEVEVTREASSSAIAERFEVDFEQDGSSIHVRGATTSGITEWLGIRRAPDVRFRIHVPQRYNLELETQGGSVSVGDLIGNVRARTAGGSLSFGTIDGSLDANTSGGHITVAEVSGTAQVRTAGGNIDVEAVEGELNARTSGGSISLGRVDGSVNAYTSGGSISVASLRNLTNDSELRTAAGSITLSVDPAAQFNVEAATSAGGINTNLGFDVEERWASASMQGVMGSGGPDLLLRTTAGSININR